MDKQTILHVGVDDTDSPHGMCTTFLAYRIVGMVRNRDDAALIDLPRLVRFNPNIPWKTRGNGAVSMKIKTKNPSQIKATIQHMVSRYSDVKHGANPGLVFLEGDVVPEEFVSMGRLALWQLVNRQSARRLVSDGRLTTDNQLHTIDKGTHLESFHQGNGQGLVGAIGAIGYDFSDDYTLELLSYRKRHKFGKPRRISAASVRAMQDKTFPNTFSSIDPDKGRVLITPHGPDPVFYGIRGDDINSLVTASEILESDERPEGYMIFRSNQATGDHLRNELTPQTMKPYASGWIAGTVSDAPKTLRGGHVFFGIKPQDCSVRTPVADNSIWCAVYKPTGISTVASRLMRGDRIRIGGGVRKALRNLPRVINIEFIDVMHLARNLAASNPMCNTCNKRMKSKGVSQGFECIRCGRHSPQKVMEKVPRTGIQKRLYIPRISAHRHLTRPLQRTGITNKIQDAGFDETQPWFCMYDNDDSGE